jgi:hypothetical protein
MNELAFNFEDAKSNILKYDWKHLLSGKINFEYARIWEGLGIDAATIREWRIDTGPCYQNQYWGNFYTPNVRDQIQEDIRRQAIEQMQRQTEEYYQRNLGPGTYIQAGTWINNDWQYNPPIYNQHMDPFNL